MLCLSFDIDWAHDAVIADTLALVEKLGLKATWFVTHATPLVEEIQRAGGHELGIHPNFNPLLLGETGTAEAVILQVLSFAPGAKSVRSHSLTRSSRLSPLFRKYGLTHESNLVIPPVEGLQVAPWMDWSQLIQVPIRWEDDIRLFDPTIGEPDNLVGRLSPLVVDFHPIHVFLNTLTIDDYEASRVDAQSPDRLLARRRPAGCGGSRDRLIALGAAVKAYNWESCLMADLSPSPLALPCA